MSLIEQQQYWRPSLGETSPHYYSAAVGLNSLFLHSAIPNERVSWYRLIEEILERLAFELSRKAN